MAGQGSAERGANRERSVKKCELTKGPALAGGCVCRIAGVQGRGACRPCSGGPKGRTKWPLTWPFKRTAFRQNEMAVDLKEVELDLKEVELDLNSRLQGRTKRPLTWPLRSPPAPGQARASQGLPPLTMPSASSLHNQHARCSPAAP